MAAEGAAVASEGADTYGTFQQPADAASKTEFDWEVEASPWRLFLSSVLLISKNLATLLLLYWTLLWGKASEKNLMLCWNPPHLTLLQQYGCEYTKAWVRSFPLLAALVVLVVALRLMVQQRIYYGFLKAGALLDFRNVAPHHDPLLLLLMVSILHALGHFAMKTADGQGAFNEEAESFTTKFLAPYVIFLIFLYSSYDIELLLVPLNKYVEEDPENARKVLGNIHFCEEDVVRSIVMKHDVIGELVEASGEDGTTAEAMYDDIIVRYPQAKAEMQEDEQTFKFHLKEALWPGRILIDPRLTDAGSVSFRFMFDIFVVVLVLPQFVIMYFLLYQAVYKDLYKDVYLRGFYTDLAGAVVLLLHVVFVFWLLDATLWPVISKVTAHQAEKVTKLAGTAVKATAEKAATVTHLAETMGKNMVMTQSRTTQQTKGVDGAGVI